jgi:hypothetical protein
MDSKQPSSTAFETTPAGGSVLQAGEHHRQEEIVQLPADALSFTDYRLYKRRWLGLGVSPTPSTHKAFHPR